MKMFYVLENRRKKNLWSQMQFWNYGVISVNQTKTALAFIM